MDHFIDRVTQTQYWTQGSTTQATSEDWFFALILAAVLCVIFYFILAADVRRHNRRTRELQSFIDQTVASIPGDLARAGVRGKRKSDRR